MKKTITYGIVGILALSFISSANSQEAPANSRFAGMDISGEGSFTDILNKAYGQEIRDGIYEDQVIICVNGNVIEQSGNICKVFNVDDQSLIEAQDDLYQNPESDTFEMDVRD